MFLHVGVGSSQLREPYPRRGRPPTTCPSVSHPSNCGIQRVTELHPAGRYRTSHQGQHLPACQCMRLADTTDNSPAGIPTLSPGPPPSSTPDCGAVGPPPEAGAAGGEAGAAGGDCAGAGAFNGGGGFEGGAPTLEPPAAPAPPTDGACGGELLAGVLPDDIAAYAPNPGASAGALFACSLGIPAAGFFGGIAGCAGSGCDAWGAEASLAAALGRWWS